mmetsp:Transcript_2770/g.5059  ORF Transcript_2770/g.5059 Transcript_2770/m.5059 type:complete len:104 (+) Transcript_2770:72-383(+)
MRMNSLTASRARWRYQEMPIAQISATLVGRKASTLFFESSEEYRHHIAVRKVLFGTIKGIYLAGSVEFQNTYTQSFLQQLWPSLSLFLTSHCIAAGSFRMNFL